MELLEEAVDWQGMDPCFIDDDFDENVLIADANGNEIGHPDFQEEFDIYEDLQTLQSEADYTTL